MTIQSMMPPLKDAMLCGEHPKEGMGKPKRETAGFSVMHFPAAQVKEVEAALPFARSGIAARVAAVTGAPPPNAEPEAEAGEEKKDAA